MFKKQLTENINSILILIILLSPVILSAQTSSPSNNIGKDPIAYGADEFSPGLNDLRRFEQIFFGAFPLSIFFAQLLGGVGILIKESQYQGEGSAYVPKFGVENYSTDDKIKIITAGIGISFGIAIADMIIYQERKKEEEKRYKRIRLLDMKENVLLNSSNDSLNHEQDDEMKNNIFSPPPSIEPPPIMGVQELNDK